MGRNIILFSDGTGNSAASTTKTNVWRVYDALDLTGGDQLATFDDGVGTSSFQPLRYVGLALGWGIKRNVLDLYKFLCRNYKSGDSVYAFGFSRGAFTIRLLCSLIDAEGLIEYKSDEDLDEMALAAYRRHRKTAFAQPFVTRVARSVRSLWTHEEKKAPALPCDIAFVGIWDTVVAYGLPIDELTIAVSKWIWPMTFADTDLPPSIKIARHAMALDDERRTFHPVRWNEAAVPRPYGTTLSDDRLLQVWFAGVHANVGGGYPDDRLAHVSLVWMLEEAARYGLRFDDRKIATYQAIASFDGPIYDSRAGTAAAFRYQPRSLSRLMEPTGPDRAQVCNSKGPTHWRPLLHHSVVQRMASGSDHYAPISVDTDVDILAPDNVPVPFALPEPGTPMPASTGAALRTLLSATGSKEQRQACGARALDFVWWRRVLYFVMLFSLIGLASLSLLDHVQMPGQGEVAATVVGDVLSIVTSVLRPFTPSYFNGWVDAFLLNSMIGIPLLVAFVVAYRLSGKLQTRIRDWAAASWNNALHGKILGLDIKWKNEQIRRYRNRALWSLGLAAGTALVRVFVLPSGLHTTADHVTGVLLGFGILSGAASAALALHRFRQPADALPTWWMLNLARGLRTKPSVVAGYRWFALTFLPDVSLIVATVALVAVVIEPVVLQVQFQARMVMGGICVATTNPKAVKPGPVGVGAAGRFNVSSLCWASGLTLEKGHYYEITLVVPDGETDWFDRTTRTDMRGFPTESFVHKVAFLSKRWLNQNWFAPIARIGADGAVEFPLTPVRPLPEAWPLDSRRQAEFDAIMDRQRGGRSAPIDNEAAVAATALYREAETARIPLRSVFVAPKDGELFLYVNDAIPNPIADTYANNRGVATVSVRDITDDWPCPTRKPADMVKKPVTCEGDIPSRMQRPPR